MGTVTFLAPANPQWGRLELKMMGVLRREFEYKAASGCCSLLG